MLAKRHKENETMKKTILEEEYRRGYTDGFISGMQALADYTGQDIPAQLFRFWQDALLTWKDAQTDDADFPPSPPLARMGRDNER